jgi:predicted transcriptional regulator
MNEGVYHRRLLAEAEKALRDEGREATVDRVAEHLGIDPRTVRRWRAVSA